MDGRLYEDANVAMSPSDTPSGNGDKVLNESNHKTSSSEQDLKAPTKRQDLEKISGVNGLGPDPNIEPLAHKDSDEEEIVYPSGMKLFILASVLPLNHHKHSQTPLTSYPLKILQQTCTLPLNLPRRSRQHHHRDRRPPHHGPIRQPQRCRLVRE